MFSSGVAAAVLAIAAQAGVCESGSDHPIVIEDATILTMVDGAEPISADIVIEGDRIVAIGDAAETTGPCVARIAAGGQFVLPGFIDMHTHIPGDVSFRGDRWVTDAPTHFFDTQDQMTPYLAGGITTTLTLGAGPANLAQRLEIARGDAIGPKMALAPIIDGGDGDGWTVSQASEAAQTVKLLAAENYDFIKPYSNLDRESLLALSDAGKGRNMRLVGHIPYAFKENIAPALEAIDLLAHAEELTKFATEFTPAEAVRLAGLAKDGGVTVTPTLIALKQIADQTRSLDGIRNDPAVDYIHPILYDKWLNHNRNFSQSSPELIAHLDSMVAFQKDLVAALAAQGVPMLVGTDTLGSGIVGGSSFHDEMALMVEAGLDEDYVLRAATVGAAKWLGITEDRGTIEVGKRADLVLLAKDPRVDIANTRSIAAVVIDGRLLTASRLDEMLADLATRNRARQGEILWSERRD